MTLFPVPAFDVADEQAAEWCLRLAENDLGPNEQAAFDIWYAVPANAEAFESAAAVWAYADGAGECPEMIDVRAKALAELRRAIRRRWATNVGGRWQWPIGLAAAFVGLLWVAIALLNGSATSYETGIGERRVVMLDDGSRLSMDGATYVEVRMEEGTRELRLLAGRAKFDVKKDPLRPFSVSAAGKLVVATGTSFSVELLSDQLRVVLYEGRVEVLDRTASRPASGMRRTDAATTEEARLIPGRELVTPLGAGTAIAAPIDLSRSLVWETGQVNFDGEPLETAVERFNRYSEPKLAVGDASAAAIRVSGVFTAGDTKAFVEEVTTLHPVRVDVTSGTLTFRIKDRLQSSSK